MPREDHVLCINHARSLITCRYHNHSSNGVHRAQRRLTTTNDDQRIHLKMKQSTFLEWVLPRRTVAVVRLRNNSFALVVLLLVAQLAPIVPSPTTCLWLLFAGRKGIGKIAQWLCWIGEQCCCNSCPICIEHLILHPSKNCRFSRFFS